MINLNLYLELLRGLLAIEGDTQTDDDRLANYQRIQAVKAWFSWDRPDDERVGEYIEAYVTEHGKLPTLQTVRVHFEQESDPEVLQRLQQVLKYPELSGEDYSHRLEPMLEARGRVRLIVICKEAEEILGHGYRHEGVRYQGLRDALRFLDQEIPLRIAPQFRKSE